MREVLIYDETLVDSNAVAAAWKGPAIPVLGEPSKAVAIYSTDQLLRLVGIEEARERAESK